MPRTTGGPDPVAVLRHARRPEVPAGAGAVRCEASGALLRLAEGIGAPVVVSPMPKGVFPEDHPLFAGALDMACNQVLCAFLAGSDLVIAAGFDPVELIRPWSLTVPVLHVDTTPNTDQVYPSDCEVVGDVSASLDWLADGWRGRPRWTERDIAAHRDRLRTAYYAGRVAGRLNPTDVVRASDLWNLPSLTRMSALDWG